ncbi:hypothetical protein HOY82DRAFT_574591, partial [Tuber indicum]
MQLTLRIRWLRNANFVMVRVSIGIIDPHICCAFQAPNSTSHSFESCRIHWLFIYLFIRLFSGYGMFSRKA